MSDEQALLAVEREIALLFRRGRARVGELSRQVHPELEGMGYSMLGFVEQAGKVRLTDIGAHFSVGKATVSRQVKALEEIGLLAREIDPLDRRAALVSLTEDGTARYLRVRDARTARFRELLETWPQDDVVRFADLLVRFNDLTEEPAGS
ncbi:MarR family winged helix-turn-helix transcriptional regulator [Kitasatospora sp. NBC_00315]|uniref:MarR family winged helix-turn-helix transcriptional regulator n=1 Tax=Kitasatospora sp. NBC_00315 TaxID=2975963 RepID=UPI003244F65A